MSATEVTRTFDLLQRMQRLFPKEDALAGNFGGKWVKYSTEDYVLQSHLLAYGFLETGLKKGDKVITITPNRPAWNFIDMSLAMANIIHIPIYSTLNTEEFNYIAIHSDAKAIIIGSYSIYNSLRYIIPKLPKAPQIICIDPTAGEVCLEDIATLGRQSSAKWKFIVDEIKEKTTPGTISTIDYNYSTSGYPEGKILTHYNLLSEIPSYSTIFKDCDKIRMLSFMPLCNSHERSMNYVYQMIGAGIYYAERPSTIMEDSAETNAEGFYADAPTLDMILEKLQQQLQQYKGLRKHICQWALAVASNFDYNRNFFYRLKLLIADRLVLKKWRDAFGGHEMYIVTSGETVKKQVIRILSAAKLHVTEIK